MAERNALEKEFEFSKLILCVFHFLQVGILHKAILYML